MRLDAYVAKHWPEFSRSTWQKLIENGSVVVNDVTQKSSKFLVKENDTVTVTLPEIPTHDGKELPVLYEDDDVIVINKPVGVLTHSKGALNDEFTVAEFVRRKTTYKSDTNRPGIVHRLDRATSGVIICAKNQQSASLIQKQFTNRTLKKKYVALVHGVPKNREALIDVPIGRNPSAPSQFRADPNGKAAQTTYAVRAENGHESLVELAPKTGRTHQLRVHMNYIGCPIVGDEVYGKTSNEDRMYLHAFELELTLPGGNRKVFTAPVPHEFEVRVKL